MTLRDDTRGQAIQIGAVLLFGTLIVAFSSYQAFVVPEQNREVEFNHNQEVQQDMQDLRNAIVSLPGGGTDQSVALTLGTRYPSRLVALNPGPATGSLRTAGTTDRDYNLTLRNVTASSSESPETADFWNGTDRNYSTGALVYQPNYNVYQNAPETVYENSVVHNQQRDGGAVLADQRLIDGKEITLVTLNGSLDTSQTDRLSVDVRAASSSDRTVSVWNESHNLTIELPTRLSESNWKSLLEAERTDGYVTNVSVDEDALDDGYGLLSVTLQKDTNYTLRMTKAGVGTGVETPGVEYITDVEGDGTNVLTGSDQQLVLEARDRYNNPVSDVDVSVIDSETTLNGGELDQRSRTTGTDGRVRFTYTAGSSTGDASVTFNVSDDADVTPREKVTLDLSVIEGGDSNNNDDNNDGTASGVQLVSVGEGNNRDRVSLIFTLSVGQGIQKTVTQVETRVPGNSDNGQTVQDNVNSFLRDGNEVSLDVDRSGGDNQDGYRGVNVDGLDVPGIYDLGNSDNGQNAIFEDGAGMTVTLGEINGGDVELKYEDAGSESSADITVTLQFKDGTSYDVYLEVTKVKN